MQENKDKIIALIGQKRYEHSLRVMDVAIELSKIYGEDKRKAAVAGYYHDCAKIKNVDLLHSKCIEYGLKLTHDMKMNPQIIHGHLGALIAKADYGIEDEDILNSIRWHTTGRIGMSLLEKIVFIADYIEPGRNFPEVELARKLARTNINKAVYFSLNNTIIHLCNSNSYIATDTLLARNYILEIENETIF